MKHFVITYTIDGAQTIKKYNLHIAIHISKTNILKLENFIDDIDEYILSSMDICKRLLWTDLKLYLNVEIIIQILCVASISVSVESIGDS